MVLKHLLSQKRVTMVDRWFQLILDTYPAEGAKIFKQNTDRFVNPVGYTVSREIATIYEELLQGMNPDKLSASLDNVIRIRAVQDFVPSQAIAFIFLLKEAIRGDLESEIRENQLLGELLEFESRIDSLALFALDIYVKCREKVYELRVNEVKAEREMALKLLERVNLMSGEVGTEQGFQDEKA